MDERDWTDRRLAADDGIELSGVSIRLRPFPNQTFVSGDLPTALTALSSNAPILGLGAQIGSTDFAIRISRDTALLISKSRPTLPSGWHSDGYALSDAGAAYDAFEISGPSAGVVVAQMTSADLNAGSPSSAVRFAGQTVLLLMDGDAFLAFVPTAYATFATTFFRSALT